MLPIAGLHLGIVDVETWTIVGRAPALLLIVMLGRAGARRGWPPSAALLATAAFAAGLSLGTALLPSILGAVAGAILVWLAAQRALGLGRPPLADLAIGLGAVLAVGRIGCLLAGCCFGTVTDLPWAVHYGPGSNAWVLHRALGEIPPGAPASLPVHPIPLYETAGLAVWLALAWRLRRRLRSEAALLLLTVAVDLALRAGIDGHRAMVNVVWALRGDVAGLDWFRAALVAGAVLAAAGALGLELAARRRAVVVGAVARAAACGPVAPTPADARRPWASWAVFVAVLAIALGTDAAQTPFLHAIVLLAIGVAGLGLRLPRLEALAPAKGAARSAWPGPAIAVTLVAGVALHTAGGARLRFGGEETTHDLATTSAADEGPARRWIYEVDPRRRLLVRVGSSLESGATLAAVRASVGLPDGEPRPLPVPGEVEPAGEPEPAGAAETAEVPPAGISASPAPAAGAPSTGPGEPPAPARGADFDRRPQVWVGIAGAYDSSHAKSDNCSGPAQIVDRRGGGASLSVDASLPVQHPLTVLVGARGGVYSESVELSGAMTGTDRVLAAYLQGWLELDLKYFGIGVGGMGASLQLRPSRASEPARTSRQEVFLGGGRLRVGAPAISFDAGYLDRYSILGPSAHVFVAGDVKSAQATRVLRYHLGLEGVPTFHGYSRLADGLDVSAFNPAFGFGLELRLDPGFGLGFDIAAGESYAVAGWLLFRLR